MILGVLSWGILFIGGMIETILYLSLTQWYFNKGFSIYNSSRNLTLSDSEVEEIIKKRLLHGWIVKKSRYHNNNYIARTTHFSSCVLRVSTTYDMGKLTISIRPFVTTAAVPLFILFWCLSFLFYGLSEGNIHTVINAALSGIIAVPIFTLPIVLFSKLGLSGIIKRFETL